MLECPHSHPVPPETRLEFYCKNCRTNHQLPENYIENILEKTHREFLDKILAKLTTNVTNTIELHKKTIDILDRITI